MINARNKLAFIPNTTPYYEYDSFQLLLKYFLLCLSPNYRVGDAVKQQAIKRGLSFRTQNDIGKALTQVFGLQPRDNSKSAFSQSAISQMLKQITHQEIVIDGRSYRFCKVDGAYTLEPIAGSIEKLFDIKDAFVREKVLKVSDNTLAFSLNPKNAEAFLDTVRLCFPERIFFSTFLHEGTLILMFDDTENGWKECYTQFSNYFKLKENHDIAVLQRKKAEERREEFEEQRKKREQEHQKQDRAIVKARKRVGKYIY